MGEGKHQLKREFTLEGLDCANCAMKIERGVSSINGVKECNVNFATQTISLQYDKEQEVEILTKAEKTITRLEPHVKLLEKQKRQKKKAQSHSGEHTHEHVHDHNHNHDHDHGHSHAHGHTHEHGSNDLKKMISRLIIGGIIFGLGIFAPLSGTLELVTFLIAYLIVGGDIVLRAIKNITRGQVFDEH
ncbi:heavy-metal-associated domain-containing protein, partial [Alkaliphilus crotonatoxidans]